MSDDIWKKRNAEIQAGYAETHRRSQEMLKNAQRQADFQAGLRGAKWPSHGQHAQFLSGQTLKKALDVASPENANPPTSRFPLTQHGAKNKGILSVLFVTAGLGLWVLGSEIAKDFTSDNRSNRSSVSTKDKAEAIKAAKGQRRPDR